MDQADILVYLLKVLDQQKLKYAIAGSHASMAFGEPRLTNDIDVLIALTPASLAGFCGAVPSPDFYISEDGARTAASRGGMFNIIHPESGVKIDVIVPANEFERSQLQRAVLAPVFAGGEGYFSAPEDVIIK